jgi:hypothetical protein
VNADLTSGLSSDLSTPLGVCVLPSPRLNAARTVTYPRYIHEMLRHAGLCYAEIELETLGERLPHLRLLLTVGDALISDDLAARLAAWVEGGGRWIATGGDAGLHALFGVTVEPPAYTSFGGGTGMLGEGYLAPQSEHPAFAHLALPLHYFNGLPIQATDANVLATVLDAHQRATPRAAVTEKKVGAGACLLIAPDITGTVVRIQQGVGVTRDGVPAPDGTSPQADEVLKSGDGHVLDWIFDREPVANAPGMTAFLQPIADQWRELLLRALFAQALAGGVRLPLLWLYPDNLPALVHLSHDTDGNDLALGERLLEVVNEAGIHSTWCVIMPGYPREFIAQIAANGHELAMHYDAISEGCPWSHELFHQQWQGLVELFGQEPVSNKNHYLRWEGDVELFRWCVEHGIQLDQTKGASKTGEAGFNFGTCRPYFPVDFAGNVLDVLELPTPTQDLEIFAPTALLYPLLDAALRHHGIIHLLFHPAHIAKPGVADAIFSAVRESRAAGMAWWTAAQINAWERARRQVIWSEYQAENGTAQVMLTGGADLPGATILWLGDDAMNLEANGAALNAKLVTRWGFPFHAVTLDVCAQEPVRLSLGA